jgi:hypothetical protein
MGRAILPRVPPYAFARAVYYHIGDPKAVAHFYARETTAFRMKAVSKILLEGVVCPRIKTTMHLDTTELVWGWNHSLRGR